MSGIVGGVLSGTRDARRVRIAFLLGLLLAGVVFGKITDRIATPALPLLPLAFAGLLVGAGTRLGGGCTSGHGVCGLSRLSPRSLVATLTFIGAGALTVFLVQHVSKLGGAP